MKLTLAKNSFKYNIREGLRKCGYFGLEAHDGQIAYVRRLSKSQFYPRFHLYINETASDMQFSLHLDQKKASYEGFTAHSGEYDDPIVTEEMDRIKNIITSN